MGYLDNLKALTVRVESGSGVILKPQSDEYHYILTAYHVIKDTAVRDLTITFEQNSSYNGEQVVVVDILKNEAEDVAIIIIKRLQSEAPLVFPSDIIPKNEKGWHVGYPKNQNSAGKTERCVGHEIRNWLGRYGKAFEEYQCEQSVQDKEVDGMSGGGIFDNNNHLVGIHKQFAADEKVEDLSKFVMIPWSCYEKVLEDHQMPGVLQYDLSSFGVFKDNLFNFDDNQGAKSKLRTFLTAIAYVKASMVKLPPSDAYEAFQKNRKAINYVKLHLLKEKDWILFGEFLLAVKLLTSIELENKLEDLFPKFQFVQADHDFDIFNVDQNFEPGLLGEVANKNVVFVVGGIDKKGYQQDVRPKNVVRINQSYKTNDRFDIARLGREVFSEITFVNGNLFKDAMLENTSQIMNAPGDGIDFYKQLLSSQIWPVK